MYTINKPLLIIPLCIVLLVFISSCGLDTYTPKATIELSEKKVTLTNEALSDAIIVTVTKTDNDEIPSSFTINLVSPNKEMLWFVVNNDTQTTIPTGTFIRKGDRLSYTFYLEGKKSLGSDSTTFTAQVALLHQNNTLIDQQDFKVIIT